MHRCPCNSPGEHSQSAGIVALSKNVKEGRNTPKHGNRAPSFRDDVRQTAPRSSGQLRSHQLQCFSPGALFLELVGICRRFSMVIPM